MPLSKQQTILSELKKKSRKAIRMFERSEFANVGFLSEGAIELTV